MRVFLILLILSSCNRSIFPEKYFKKCNYVVKSDTGYYYVNIQWYTDSVNKLRKKLLDSAKKSSDEIESALYYQIYKLPKDTTKRIIISFHDNIPFRYSVERLYYWDHINFRAFFPPLLLFQCKHIRNQAINRGLQRCLKSECDGIIVDNSMVAYKIIRIHN